MSASSSTSVNAPIPVSGVKYAYPSSKPLPLVASSLGYQQSVNTGAVVTPISGTSVTQAYLSLGAVGTGTGFSAGTYLFYGSSVISAITGDISSYIRIYDETTGLTQLAGSPQIFFGAATPGQYQSIQPMFIATINQSFIVQSFFQSGGAGGTGTPIDAGFLGLVRLA